MSERASVVIQYFDCSDELVAEETYFEKGSSNWNTLLQDATMWAEETMEDFGATYFNIN